MDDLERKIMRRRRSSLSNALLVTDDMLDDLKAAGLLTDELIGSIKLERTMVARALRIVDAASTCPEPEAFQALCTVLEQHAPRQHQSLEADMRVQRGLVVVDERLMREAGADVHRKFGSSKRFSEGEKREIQELLAFKLQVSKDEGLRELDHVNSLLQQERCINQRNEGLAMDADCMLANFARDYAAKLTIHAHGMTSTTRALQLNVDDCSKNTLEKFQENLQKVLDRFSEILTHREMLSEERAKCLQLLKVNSMSSNNALETAVQKLMMKCSVAQVVPETNGHAGKVPARPMTAFTGNDTSDKERTIKRLNKKISDLENEIDRMEAKIEEFESQLLIRDEEVEELRVSKGI